MQGAPPIHNAPHALRRRYETLIPFGRRDDPRDRDGRGCTRRRLRHPEVGRARAQSLAATLKDAGVTAIFVTEYKRTQQTAAPLAQLLGIQPTVVSAKDTQGLIEKVKAVTGRALVVGHSNTVPEVLGKLGVENPPKLADSDYGDLFMVSRGDTTTLFRLHYR